MPGPPTPMPLPQSFLAMLIPVIDPQRNGTAMHLQVISYFSRGLPIQAHQNPLDAQHYSRFLILLCLASNFQQLGDGGLISVRECWAHIAHHCSFFGVCRIIYAHLYSFGNVILQVTPPPAFSFQLGRLTEPALDAGGIVMITISRRFAVRYDVGDTLIFYEAMCYFQDNHRFRPGRLTIYSLRAAFSSVSRWEK